MDTKGQMVMKMCNTGLAMLDLARMLRGADGVEGAGELSDALFVAADRLSLVTDKIVGNEEDQP